MGEMNFVFCVGLLVSNMPKALITYCGVDFAIVMYVDRPLLAMILRER